MSGVGRGGPVVIRISSEDDGQRLDRVVAGRLGALGRRGTAVLFRSGAVRVDGRPAKKGERAHAGASIEVAMPGDGPLLPEPSAPLEIRLLRDDVLVVEKPAGQPTAPLGPLEAGTLAGALVGHYPELLGIGHQPREPGLLHRLDTETSGLLVVARSGVVFERLRGALSGGRIEKRYLAIVPSMGLAESGEIDRPLGPDPHDSRRVAVLEAGGRRARHAVTRFRRQKTSGPWALVEIDVSRAYRHQIRVHFASIGYPLAGDSLYGGASVPELGARHALHASYVAWAGDEVVPEFSVTSSLPADLAGLAGG